MARQYWPIHLRRLEAPAPLKDKNVEREEIIQATKDYLSNGGKVEEIPYGKTGEAPVVFTSRNRSLRL